MKFIVGFIFGIVIFPICMYVYFTDGAPPVAVGDRPFPNERLIAHRALNARIDREAPKSAPVEANDAAFVAGAQIYRSDCMVCHGQPVKTSRFEKAMYPEPPQLWVKHGDHIGVSDDPPGETYWKVRNGIRLTGMPGFSRLLDETQLWQVSLLLANAEKPLPAAALEELAKPPAE